MFCCCFDTVYSSEVAVIERSGNISRLADEGWFCLFPGERVVGRVSLRLQELTIHVESKTLDGTTVTVKVCVQHQIIREKIASSFHAQSNKDAQLRTNINASIETSLSIITLGRATESEDEIAASLKSHLQQVMNNYGTLISDVVVTISSPNLKS